MDRVYDAAARLERTAFVTPFLSEKAQLYLKREKVVCVLSGRNIDAAALMTVLETYGHYINAD